MGRTDELGSVGQLDGSFVRTLHPGEFIHPQQVEQEGQLDFVDVVDRDRRPVPVSGLMVVAGRTV